MENLIQSSGAMTLDESYNLFPVGCDFIREDSCGSTLVKVFNHAYQFFSEVYGPRLFYRLEIYVIDFVGDKLESCSVV